MFRLLLFFCICIALEASVGWFYKLPIKSYEIVGYGSGKNLSNARKMAIAEISESIKIKVVSDTQIQRELRNGKYKSSHSNTILTSANNTLKGIKTAKEEFCDGVWYVAVLYDNRTLMQKIKQKYPNFSKSDLKNLKNLNIERKDGEYYLKIENDLYLLGVDDFLDIFSNIDNKDLVFNSNKKIYNSKDIMGFRIVSKDSGFVSILYSERDAKVGLILANSPIDKKLFYPKKDAKESLIAYNPSDKTVTELYICIFSKKKLDLREFEAIDDELLDKSNYNFDRLIDLIKNNRFSTIKIKIKHNLT